MPLTVGVIGGMGPLATVEAFRLITAATPAHRDQDHLHVLVDSCAATPDRTLALLHGGPNPLPWLQRSAVRLIGAGAEVLCLPCNTAHAFYDDLVASLSVPVVHMINETLDRVWGDGRRYALLATAGTVNAGIYTDAFAKRGLPLDVPSPAEQVDISTAIAAVKEGRPLVEAAGYCVPVVQALADRGAQGVVLGCTEMSLLREALTMVLPTMDALQIMADAVVAHAFSGLHAGPVTSLADVPAQLSRASAAGERTGDSVVRASASRGD